MRFLLEIGLTLIGVIAIMSLSARDVRGEGHLVILHTNDMHGHILPWTGWEGALEGRTIGGADRLASAVAQVRGEAGENNVLLLDGGDAIGDSMIADLTKGRAVIDVMAAIGFDAMTLGNHEVDFGVNRLRKLIASNRFPVVAANVREVGSGQFLAKPEILIEKAGLKIGLIGLAYPKTPLTTASENVKGLEFVADSFAVVTERLNELKKQKPNLVIVLSHLGLSADLELAKKLSDVDVIVSGHSHNQMEQSMKVGSCLVVQSGAHAAELGRLDLQVDGTTVTGKHRLIILDHARIPSDPEVASLVGRLVEPFKGQMEERLGEATELIARADTMAGPQPGKRVEQSPADSLFADIIRAETKSDVTLLPGVGYGVAIPPGPITASQLRNLIPHGSKVVTLELTGQQIQEILNQSLRNTYTEDVQEKVGGLIQVSGLEFRYRTRGSVGPEILSVSVGGEQLGAQKSYRVATNSLLASGGHNYQTFRQGKNPQEVGVQYEMIKRWIQKNKRVSVPKDKRIHRVE